MQGAGRESEYTGMMSFPPRGNVFTVCAYYRNYYMIIFRNPNNIENIKNTIKI